MNQVAQLQSITAAEVRQAALKWLDPAKEWRFQVLPAAKN
jgi:hypothetical protein